MDIVEEIKSIVLTLDKIDNYKDQLSELMSNSDLKMQDIEHYIENNKLNARECCKIVAEIRNIRQDRRKYKNDITLISTYLKNQNKLLEVNNRRFLLAEINKTNKQLGKKYTNRAYTEQELNEIIGKEMTECINN